MEDQNPESANLTPRHLSKADFGRRLYQLMIGKGWTQSELARRAGIARDNVSRYVRGLALPTPQNLTLLAEALSVPKERLLPNYLETAIGEDPQPAFEIRASTANNNVVWLRVNRAVTMSSAVKIADILEHDKITDAS